MAKQTQASTPSSDTGISWRGHFSLDQREGMIREAAYFRYLDRGCSPGHDLEDWLEAEAELDHDTLEIAAGAEGEVQQSSVRSAREDEDTKRMIKREPQRRIPQVESIEAKEAPPKE